MQINIFGTTLNLPEIQILQNTSFLGVSAMDYIIAAIIFIVMVAVLRVFKFIVLKRLKALSKKTKNEIDDMVIEAADTIGWPFYMIFGLYISLQTISLPAIADKALFYVFLITIIYYVAKVVSKMVGFGKDIIVKKQDREENESAAIDVLAKILKGVVWVIAILVLLSNIGINITSLIAGLGIGGIAIALALQNILSDLFASFSIYFDKPFKVGDFIIIGDHMGVVKHIGIKTTRLESLWGEEIVVSNKELTSTRINNYKRMERRRIHMTFGVTYQTPDKKLKKILKIVEEIFNDIELAELDRVHFKEFAASSLNYEIAFYVNSQDYNKYMDVRQDINFALKERLEKEGVEFAYPTQTIFLEKD